ncbi:MAG: hypothetical protein JNL74_17370, partial [Fibrobacteres bacterium]|nr:hypothetical protein [Fibrobacterota bacterium]
MNALMWPFVTLTKVSEKALDGFVDTFVGLNKVYTLIWNVIKRAPHAGHRFKFTVEQMMALGVTSLPLI